MLVSVEGFEADRYAMVFLEELRELDVEQGHSVHWAALVGSLLTVMKDRDDIPEAVRSEMGSVLVNKQGETSVAIVPNRKKIVLTRYCSMQVMQGWISVQKKIF